MDANKANWLRQDKTQQIVQEIADLNDSKRRQLFFLSANPPGLSDPNRDFLLGTLHGLETALQIIKDNK